MMQQKLYPEAVNEFSTSPSIFDNRTGNKVGQMIAVIHEQIIKKVY